MISAFSMSNPAKTPLRAKYDQKQNAIVEARLEYLLDQIAAAARTMNVCALNLQSAEAIFRRTRLWLVVGICIGLAVAALAGPHWPW